ncbi:hypothetical protein BT63DRAFT_459587 [Microthyrium microscopicum]|uniref:DUF7600 domain-containing protein n=1 Tax=Microthyrium microscopicum TaxID=703497 RepID=A0A6A6TZ47_9PEZI|nr:hypothetical protein BT63DRAFT_459587 [Microthyrium microscopicum]
MADFIRYCCPLCGCPIGGACYETWIHEIRALYVTDWNDWTDVNLSGVGWSRANTDSDIVPQNIGERYKGPHPKPIKYIEVTRMLPTTAPSLGHHGANKAMGYSIHDACWNILERACDPEPIHLQSLMLILRSFPNDQGIVNWGHTYGNLFKPMNSEHRAIPGQTAVFTHRYDKSQLTDPGDCGLQEEFIAWAQDQTNDHLLLRTLGVPSQTRDDCLEKLPFEIRAMILPYISSSDMLNMIFSSAAFRSSELLEIFFKSRFAFYGEHEYVLEAQTLRTLRSGRQHVSWHSVYSNFRKYLPTHAMTMQRLRSRKRIWHLVLPLAHLVVTHQGLEPEGQVFPAGDLQHQSKQRLASTDLVYAHGSWLSAVAFYRKITINPTQITRIDISRLAFHGAIYTSGLKIFQDGKTDVLDLGYPTLGQKSSYKLDHSTVANDKKTSMLTKLYAVVAPLGILALSTVPDDVDLVKTSFETGRKIDVMEFEAEQEIELKAHFDAFRMISLQIEPVFH